MLKNIRPLFRTAQILGVNIFEINDRKLKISKKQILYYAVMYILNTAHLTYGIYLTFYDDGLNLRKKIFSVIRTLLGFACTTVDTVMTMASRDNLRSALDCLHLYDTSSRYNLNYSKREILDHSRSAIIFITAWWTVVGYIASRINSASDPYYFAFSYVHFYTSMSLQIFIFCGLTLLIYQRFNHLGRMIITNDSMRLRINQMKTLPYNIELQDVWWLHSNLILAAEKINYVYSMQILLWIFSFSLNCLSRIYTLTNDNNSSSLIISRELLCLIGCFFNVFVIIFVCHVTGKKGNQIAKEIFSPTSIVSIKTTISKNDDAAMAYFCVKKLYFLGGYGLIRVHLPLLISIVGAITTYLVILHKH